MFFICFWMSSNMTFIPLSVGFNSDYYIPRFNKNTTIISEERGIIPRSSELKLFSMF